MDVIPQEILLIDNVGICKQMLVLFCLFDYFSNLARYLPKFILQSSLNRKNKEKKCLLRTDFVKITVQASKGYREM